MVDKAGWQTPEIEQHRDGSALCDWFGLVMIPNLHLLKIGRGYWSPKLEIFILMNQKPVVL